MQLIASFVQNPVKVAVGVILVAMFGTIALFNMPIQLTPEVQIPTISVETRWPGASPQEVEREIVQEQEEQLKSVEGVTRLSSESMDSMGRVTMEFLVGTNMEEALLKVNTRLQQVREYPEEADQPVIHASSASDRPIAWFILTQRPPPKEQLLAFAKTFPDPELDTRLETCLATDNPGLLMYRLRKLAREFPALGGLIPEEIDITTLRTFAEDYIESEFERVKGVANADVMGGRELEVQVVVNPEELAARELTIVDLRNALRGQNADTSGGDFWEGKRRYVVRTIGQFRTLEQVAETILARRDGVPVYVRDVAEVRFGHRKPEGVVRRFGTSCIGLRVQRETGTNVMTVMEGLKAANRELNDHILKYRGLQLTQVYDDTEYINSAIGMVNENIIFGGLLTVGGLLLFLRSGRSTFIVTFAIVASIVGTFLAMHLFGRTLNVISLAGLAFAVGMLVDNGIVVLENIYRHHQLGKRRIHAVVHGTGEVWSAVLSSSLANLAVFLPILFVKDEAGQLFRDIALAISSAVGLSVLVAVIVVPTAASLIMTDQYEGAKKGRMRLTVRLALGALFMALGVIAGQLFPDKAIESYSVALCYLLLLLPLDWLGRGFLAGVVGINAFLQRSVLLRLATVAAMTAASIYGSYLFLPKVEYLPTGNRNLVIGFLIPPPGYNIPQLLEMGERISERLRPYWDIDPKDPAIAQLDYPAIADFFFVARGRQVFMGLRAVQASEAGKLVDLVRKVSSDIPGTIAVAKQTSLFEQGLEAGRTIDVEISGPKLTRLVELGGQIMQQLAPRTTTDPVTGAERTDQLIPNAQAAPRPSLDLSSPEVHVEPKSEQMADNRLWNRDLGYTVDALVDGAFATDFYLGGDKIDLRIVGQEEFAHRTQDLESLPVATPDGQLVPLGSLANVALRSGPEQINHRERQRAITIQVTPPPQIALEDAMQRINEHIVLPLREGNALEGGYHIRLAGTADKLRATWHSLRFNLVLAAVITYLLMAALFESWLYPLVVIVSVPLGAVGGFAALKLLNLWVMQPLDVITMLGFVILVGTVVNNPILIVEQSLVHIRNEGLPMRQAVLESVRNRIRPIFMTMLTTIFGLAPLVLSPGSGSELYRGLGAVLLGGLTLSTVFSLVLIPTLFTLTMESVDSLKRAMAGIWPAATAGRASAASAAVVEADLPVVAAHAGNGASFANGNGLDEATRPAGSGATLLSK
jgi:HAE1 family hydrophobic/amphiphilic exporter-1